MNETAATTPATPASDTPAEEMTWDQRLLADLIVPGDRTGASKLLEQLRDRT